MKSDLGEGQIPFSAFVAELRAEKFPVGVDSLLRVSQLLEKADGGLHPAHLKTLLCPLLATGPDEQNRFYEIFNRFYGIPQTAHTDTAPEAVRRTTTVRVPRRLILWTLGAAVLIVLGVMGWFFWSRNSLAHTSQPTVSTTTTVVNLPNTGSEAPREPEETNRFWWRWLLLALPFTVYGLVLLILRHIGGYLIRQSEKTRLGVFGRNARVRLPLARAPGFAQSVRRLRRRVVVPSQRIDMARTIRSTIERAEFPTLHFKSDSKRPEYFVLIDRASSRDHQAALLAQLVSQLCEGGQLSVEQYFYTGDPRVCVSAKQGAAFYLAQLLTRMPSHRVLIFGDGAALWNSFTGERPAWTAMLEQRAEVALLTPSDNWGAREEALRSWLTVRPATLGGLAEVLDVFEQRPQRSWTPESTMRVPEYPAIESRENLDVYLDAMRVYLGESNFRWMAACALYPRLEWDLALHLGEEIDPALLNHENLLMFASLPWFRKGYFPIALHQALFELVDRTERRRLHKKILVLLESGMVAPEGLPSLEILVQRFGLSPLERQKFLSDDALTQLAVIAGRGRIALRIPERLRRALFRYGLPGIGLRFLPLAGLVCLAIIGLVGALVARIPKPRGLAGESQRSGNLVLTSLSTIPPTFHASGGTPPYYWSLRGSLPPGYRFDTASGRIIGSCLIGAGLSEFTVTVRDVHGAVARAEGTIGCGVNTPKPNDPDFKRKVDQLRSLNEALLAASYILKDPAYPGVLSKLPTVRDTLISLSSALDAAAPAVSAANQPLYDACMASVRLASRRVTTAAGSDPNISPDVRYGFVAALLREGTEQLLPKAIEACKNKLSPALNNPAVTTTADRLEHIRQMGRHSQ